MNIQPNLFSNMTQTPLQINPYVIEKSTRDLLKKCQPITKKSQAQKSRYHRYKPQQYPESDQYKPINLIVE